MLGCCTLHQPVRQATAVLWAVLTPVQYAHLAVGCPAPVNMLQLADTLAVATGQPSAQAVLAQLAEHLAGGCSAYALLAPRGIFQTRAWSNGHRRCAVASMMSKARSPLRCFPQSPAQLSVHLKHGCLSCNACHRCHKTQNAVTTIMLNRLNRAHAACACTGGGAAGPEAGAQKPKWRDVASLLEMCSS